MTQSLQQKAIEELKKKFRPGCFCDGCGGYKAFEQWLLSTLTSTIEEARKTQRAFDLLEMVKIRRETRKQTIEEIKELCSKYDKENGEYPENVLEGEAVWEYLLDSLTPKEEEKPKKIVFGGARGGGKLCPCHCHLNLNAGCQCSMCEHGIMSCSHCKERNK
jgi:hypothetical protein